YGVLLRPLPYRDPERLVLVWGSVRAAGKGQASISGPMIDEIARRSSTLSAVAGTWGTTMTLTGPQPEQIKVAFVTPNFFDMLGVRAAHGRTFMAEEGSGARNVMILSHSFFNLRFGGDAAIVGKGIPTAYGPSTVVGILPTDFQLHFPPE